MNLVVISHTKHFLTEGDLPVGWGPTVRELDALGKHFDQIYHLAYGYEGKPSAAFLPYSMPNIRFVALSPAGGHTIRDKLGILLRMPANLRIIASYLKRADAVQVRVPTALGLYVLPWISWFADRSRFTLWVKYAGNWVQPNPPLSYRLQRWFLKNNFQKSVVTINGDWPDKPSHCLAFENPCLTNNELRMGEENAINKDFEGPLIMIFVGRLEAAKGIERLINSLGYIRQGLVEELIVVGEGDANKYRELAAKLDTSVSFKGGLSRSQLNDHYSKSHLLVLPSDASEGFPKVIAEAASFGCVPLVSDVSAISQYVNNLNGVIFSNLEPEVIASEIERVLRGRVALKAKSLRAMKMASRFSYDHYCSRILKEVLKARIN